MTKEELLALHEEDAKTIKALEEKLASLRPVSVEEASQEPATEIEKILEDEALVKAFNEVVGNFSLYAFNSIERFMSHLFNSSQ